MSSIYILGDKELSISDINEIIQNNLKLSLSDKAIKRVEDCRLFLNKKISKSIDPIYGINTGFGSLCNNKVASDNLSQLQYNLVVSHACGVGEEVPEDVVKIMMILKVQSLSYGNSGVQLKTITRLIELYNNDIFPVIYEQGSLGASGDLAPLAHMSLALLGLGQANFNSIKTDVKSIYKKLGWEPINLLSKEGLALLNGTQFMSAYGVWSIIISKRLSYFADLIGAISLEGFDGRGECFNELIHKIRPHGGQIKTAKNIRDFLKGSSIQANFKEHVQDPYSFRCIPQVHGATKDVLNHVQSIFEIEINSVTDNPIIFVNEDEIISGGNFHGQPLAMALDYLAIAMSELASISERRTYQLISGQRGLPSFLVANPGLNSGFMIPQYTAASIVSQNKQLCTPASIDSIVSSNGQEDHVSMGANAATKLYCVVENVEKVLAIELMNAAQAVSFGKHNSSEFIQSIIDKYREKISFLEKDRLMSIDIEESIVFLQNLAVEEDLL